MPGKPCTVMLLIATTALCSLLVNGGPLSAADEPAPSAKKDAAKKPHIVIIVGTLHYSPQNSMPLLAKQLESHGFATTVVMPEGDPERSKNGKDLPGISALKDADLAIFFMRFLTLPDDQFKHVMDYVKSGKPIVAFRTSTHAFIYPKGHKNFKWNNDFGRYVLGTRYLVHQSGQTQIKLNDKAKKHPILTGVTETQWVSPGTLYLTSLQPGCVPLVLGSGSSKGDRLTQSQFGTFYFKEQETDIVAWTWENQWGAKVFSTSFGHVGDFSVEPTMRIIINGICWAAGHPIPSADTKIATYEVKAPPKKKKTPKKKKKPVEKK